MNNKESEIFTNHTKSQKVKFNDKIDIIEIEKEKINKKKIIHVKNVSYEDIYKNMNTIINYSNNYSKKFVKDYNNTDELKNHIYNIYNRTLEDKYAIFYLYNTFIKYITDDPKPISNPYFKDMLKKNYEGIVNMFKDGDYILISILSNLNKKQIKKLFKIKRESLDNFENDKIRTCF